MQVEEELLEQQLLQLQERIQILEKQQVALINIPVPGFSDGDPASIVHDFNIVSVWVCVQQEGAEAALSGAECKSSASVL